MWVSGRPVACLQCGAPDLGPSSEWYDEADRVWVGELTCASCGSAMLYSRRAETKEELEMAKKKTTNGSHRVTTVKSNGGLDESREVAPEPVGIGEAMRLAVKELGDVVIDDDVAPAQLRELAETYEQVVRMQAAFTTRAEAAKTAKKSLESATALLLEKVRAFTHPSSLPLFDQAEAEGDLDAMTGH